MKLHNTLFSFTSRLKSSTLYTLAVTPIILTSGLHHRTTFPITLCLNLSCLIIISCVSFFFINSLHLNPIYSVSLSLVTVKAANVLSSCLSLWIILLCFDPLPIAYCPLCSLWYWISQLRRTAFWSSSLCNRCSTWDYLVLTLVRVICLFQINCIQTEQRKYFCCWCELWLCWCLYSVSVAVNIFENPVICAN